ncbi:hypothetical protein Dimus_018539 [Dionaea muscipula]
MAAICERGVTGSPVASQDKVSSRMTDRDVCFKCKKPGHWCRDCPSPTNTQRPSFVSTSTTAAGVEYPQHYCNCGRGICTVLVSGSKKNPGRKYYRCPKDGNLGCGYFKWCDELKESEIRRSPPNVLYPICECQAGVCRRIILPGGRCRFVCHIAEGQGACGFVVEEDALPGIDEGSVITSDEGTGCDVDQSPECISDDALEEIRQIEDEFISQSGAEGSLVPQKLGHSACENILTFNNSLPMDIGGQVVAGRNCVSSPTGSAGASLPEGEDPSVSESEKRSKLNRCTWKACPEPSSLQKFDGLGTVMAGTISRAFDQLGASIMDNLTTLLESMSPKDHQKMSDEAAVTFKSLTSLGVNFKIYSDRVTGYIERAKHLAEIEEAMSKEQSSAELMARCNSEKSRYEDLSRAHSQEMSAFLASTERLQTIRQEACCLKDLLQEVEIELACREAERADIQARVVSVWEKLLESKNSWEKASEEAAQALKQAEEREIELSAAKAAFDKAKAQLHR